jgi:hypothetical protein
LTEDNGHLFSGRDDKGCTKMNALNSEYAQDAEDGTLFMQVFGDDELYDPIFQLAPILKAPPGTLPNANLMIPAFLTQAQLDADETPVPVPRTMVVALLCLRIVGQAVSRNRRPSGVVGIAAYDINTTKRCVPFV